jgi:hypothetical protein
MARQTAIGDLKNGRIESSESAAQPCTAANRWPERYTVSEEIIESVLKDLPGALYYPKFHLMTWHPIGIFDGALADDVREFIEREEYIQDAPFDRYTDLSGITKVRISVQRLSDAACRRRRVSQPVNSAIFADKKYSYVIAQIYESLMEEAVAITVRAFRERELAAQWLGVPVAILCPPAKRA